MMPKSRYQELYPLHNCPECGMNHASIPHIFAMQAQKPGEEAVKVALAPFEIVVILEGTVHPGHNMPNAQTPAHIYALLWGIPGSGQHIHNSLIYMN